MGERNHSKRNTGKLGPMGGGVCRSKSNHSILCLEHLRKDGLSINKWVYKVKRQCYESIERYKTRLVARGFRQQPGIDL